MNTSAHAVLGRHWRVAGLAETTIAKRLFYMQRSGGLDADYDSLMGYLATVASDNTRRVVVSFLRSAYRDAYALGLIDSDPTVDLPSIKHSGWRPNGLSPDEVDRLLSNLSDDYGVREHVLLALYAGLRACEIATLHTSWLRQDTQGVWMLRVLGKGGSDCFIPAHAKVVDLILSKPKGRVYPTATARKVSKNAQRAFARLGIEGGIHRARHTFAFKVLVASEGDALVTKQLLRHQSIATIQHYVEALPGKAAKVMEAIA
jgi:site-specific recombinase XerD